MLWSKIAVGFAVGVALAAACSATAAPQPLVTGVYLNQTDDVGAAEDTVLARVAASGATSVRITMYWDEVAPAVEPAVWNPSNPADPNYTWGTYDQEIEAAVSHGLQPLITMLAAPSWAQTGGPPVESPNSQLPDPTAFGRFATAVAHRYDGSFDGLPRVRWWEAWNEPNIHLYLVPQLVDKKPISPGWYRKMLNAFATAVHGIRRDNLVVAGGLAPFHDNGADIVAQDPDWGPLSFMRDLLCLSPSLKPTCKNPVQFDVWSTHPYTSGGPTHDAVLPNDVSLGDLPKMRAVLDAAIADHHVISAHKVQFWVTEFSWDTDPPDPLGVPMKTATSWVAEAMYRMWQNGVSLVTWLMLSDEPLATSFLQSGLYFNATSVAAEKPKPILAAFRFPFVAFKQDGGIYVWGRTPAGKPGNVSIQQQVGGGWRRIGVVATDQFGIFQHTFADKRPENLRAVVGATAAPSFSLTPIPDHFYNPFGEPTLLEPTTSKPKTK